MKKITLIYIPALIACVLLVFGSYTIVSWAIKTYTILDEENRVSDISIVSNNPSPRYIAKMLMIQNLDELKQRKYVCAIDDYILHDITIEKEYDKHFIFSVHYSVMTKDPETCWKNARNHIEHNGTFTIKSKFWVNKLGNKYSLSSKIE
ncbi:MAG TPA: hypothetical protein VFZ66_17005 [Herpetosiphonaceae bacterium]